AAVGRRTCRQGDAPIRRERMGASLHVLGTRGRLLPAEFFATVGCRTSSCSRSSEVRGDTVVFGVDLEGDQILSAATLALACTAAARSSATGQHARAAACAAGLRDDTG